MNAMEINPNMYWGNFWIHPEGVEVEPIGPPAAWFSEVYLQGMGFDVEGVTTLGVMSLAHPYEASNSIAWWFEEMDQPDPYRGRGPKGRPERCSKILIFLDDEATEEECTQAVFVGTIPGAPKMSQAEELAELVQVVIHAWNTGQPFPEGWEVLNRA